MPNRSNVMAGLFLVGGLVLAVAMSFWLGEAGRLLGAKHRYVAVFDLQTGTVGLQPGSDVTLAGQSVGRVARIVPRTREGPGGVRVPEAIEVELLVDAEIVFFEDAFAELSAPLLGGVSSINFGGAGAGAYEGGPPDANAVLDDGETVRGRLAPGLLAQAGLDAETVARLSTIIENIELTSARVDRIAAALELDAGPSSRSLRAILEDVEGFTARFEGAEGWTTQIGRAVVDARAFVQRLAPAADRFENLLANADAGVTDARLILDENRGSVRRIVANADAVTERVRFDTLARLNGALDQGTLTMSSFGDLGDQLNLIVDQQYPPLRRTVSNLLATSEQGRSFIGELRAQPWRVLKAPSEEDLEREPLYAATRTYADAVGDLRTVGEALEAVVARRRGADGTPRGEADLAELEQLRAEVDAAFSRYRHAEQTLLDHLGARP